MPDINSVLKNGYQHLVSSSKTSKLDAELLLSSVLKKNIEELIFNSIQANRNEIYKFNELIKRRKLGEPIAYILKKKEFWKNIFYVDKNVLIPRPDTEILIEEALKLIKKDEKKFILDIGTGSGCIIISIAKDRPRIKGTAIDISKSSIKVAKTNAKIHHLKNRVKFYHSSVDNFFKGKYDLIVSNPPYISNLRLRYLVKDIIGFEPLVSLNGGIDGYRILNKVIKKSSNLIKIGGKLILEIGFDQRHIIMKLLKKEGFYTNKIIKDYSNNDRCIIATKL